MKKLIVSGLRTCERKDIVYNEISKYIAELGGVDEIVTGGSKGVDQYSKEYALEHTDDILKGLFEAETEIFAEKNSSILSSALPYYFKEIYYWSAEIKNNVITCAPSSVSLRRRPATMILTAAGISPGGRPRALPRPAGRPKLHCR